MQSEHSMRFWSEPMLDNRGSAISLGLSFRIEVIPDLTTDGAVTYLARHPELSGCMSHGSTPGEALQNLAEARELYLRDLDDRGLAAPPPDPHPDVA
jgi:predicted RNase H-like HicB family nuclease